MSRPSYITEKMNSYINRAIENGTPFHLIARECNVINQKRKPVFYAYLHMIRDKYVETICSLGHKNTSYWKDESEMYIPTYDYNSLSKSEKKIYEKPLHSIRVQQSKID